MMYVVAATCPVNTLTLIPVTVTGTIAHIVTGTVATKLVLEMTAHGTVYVCAALTPRLDMRA